MYLNRQTSPEARLFRGFSTPTHQVFGLTKEEHEFWKWEKQLPSVRKNIITSASMASMFFFWAYDGVGKLFFWINHIITRGVAWYTWMPHVGTILRCLLLYCIKGYEFQIPNGHNVPKLSKICIYIYIYLVSRLATHFLCSLYYLFFWCDMLAS